MDSGYIDMHHSNNFAMIITLPNMLIDNKHRNIITHHNILVVWPNDKIQAKASHSNEFNWETHGKLADYSNYFSSL